MEIPNWIAQADWPIISASGLAAILSALLTNALAWARFKRAHLLDDRTEAILRQLLKDGRFRKRKFTTIQGYVPLADEKLREALLRAGAVCLEGDRGSGIEYWGLLENHKDQVSPKA